MWRHDQERQGIGGQENARSNKGLLRSYDGDANDNERSPSETSGRSWRGGSWSWPKSISWYVSVTLVMLLVVDATWHIKSDTGIQTQSLKYSDSRGFRVSDCACGSSTREAIAMGCTFDQLAAAWLPSECRDEELTDEFSRAGPGLDGAWTYYADLKGERVLNLTEVSLLADTGEHLYATEGWHLKHCNYSWRKQLRAPATGVAIEDRYYRIQHVNHCGMMLSEAFSVEPDAIAVSARVLLNSSFAEHKKSTIKKLGQT